MGPPQVSTPSNSVPWPNVIPGWSILIGAPLWLAMLVPSSGLLATCEPPVHRSADGRTNLQHIILCMHCS